MSLSSGVKNVLGKCCKGSCSCGSDKKGCGCGSGGCHCGLSDFGKKMMKVLAAIIMVYFICYLGTLIRNNSKSFNYIGKAGRAERTIVINGMGKVTGTNDIAVTTIGYSNTDKDVAKAQAENKKVMDQITADLKKLGVAEKDMQSNYSIYPDYNYTQDKGQELKGYRVSNQVTVKIRDLSKIPNILGLAGKYGATEVNGLSFTIDDPENLKAQAREKALADAQMKAAKLAQTLGVRLVGVVSFTEYEGGGDFYQPMKYSMMGAEGGGAMPLAPESISAGSRDVVMNVSMVYEIEQGWYKKR